MAVIRSELRRLRAEDFANDPSIPEKFVELIEGEIVQMGPAGKFHNRVASNLELLFRNFCQDHPELDFGGDNEGFLVKREPDTVLSPDACLYRRRPELEKTWLEFSPEIAVEVLSPSNTAAEMLYKRKTYLAAGTEQFWLVDPVKREIQIIHQDGRLVTASGDATLDGEGIAEGMQIRLAEVFSE